MTSDIYVDALKAAFKIKQMRNKSPSRLKPGSDQPWGAAPVRRCSFGCCDFQLFGRVCRVKLMLAVHLPSFWCLGCSGVEPGAVDGQEVLLGGEGNKSSSSFMADCLSCVWAICAAPLMADATSGSGSGLGKAKLLGQEGFLGRGGTWGSGTQGGQGLTVLLRSWRQRPFLALQSLGGPESPCPWVGYPWGRLGFLLLFPFSPPSPCTDPALCLIQQGRSHPQMAPQASPSTCPLLWGSIPAQEVLIPPQNTQHKAGQPSAPCHGFPKHSPDGPLGAAQAH